MAKIITEKSKLYRVKPAKTLKSLCNKSRSIRKNLGKQCTKDQKINSHFTKKGVLGGFEDSWDEKKDFT